MKQISLSGKGSAGKSTIVPFVLQYILKHQPAAKCLVVDADPHMTMTRLMGVPVAATLGQLRSAYERQIKSGQSLENESRGEFAERVMGEQCLVEMSGYDFLAMGHWELQGCQCGPNRVLGASLGELARKRGYDILVVDNEAGIEHIGRFASAIDLLLLVATPDPLFLDVADQILGHCREVQRPVGDVRLLINRAQPGDMEDKFVKAAIQKTGVPVLGVLPESGALRRQAWTGEPILSLDPTDPWVVALHDALAKVPFLNGG